MSTMINRMNAIPLAPVRAIKNEVPASFSIDFDFVSDPVQSHNFDASDFGISSVQTLFIDNSNSSAETVFTIRGNGQKLTCPPYSQGFFPVLNSGSHLNFEASSAGNVSVKVVFLNVPLDMVIWAVRAPGSVVGTVTVSGIVTVAPDAATFSAKNGFIAVGGTSQQLVAANGARKRLFIQNPTDEAGQNIAAREALYINFGAACGVNDGVSVELQPGASFDTGIGPVTTQQITINAATAGHRFIAFEM